MSKIFTSDKETTAARKELVVYINTSRDTNAAEWVPIGWHCTDASLSVDVDTDTQKDILGNVFTKASTPELSQNFDPLPIRKNQAGDPLQQLLHDQWLAQDFSKAYDTLIVYLYAGTGTPGDPQCKYDAHRFPASTIVPGNFGGSAEDPLNRSITVHYGGTVEVGTVTIDAEGSVTFIKANVLVAKEENNN